LNEAEPDFHSSEFKTTDGDMIESRGILPLNRRVEKPVEAAQTVRQGTHLGLTPN
jgi:hypothetical protein